MDSWVLAESNQLAASQPHFRTQRPRGDGDLYCIPLAAHDNNDLTPLANSYFGSGYFLRERNDVFAHAMRRYLNPARHF